MTNQLFRDYLDGKIPTPSKPQPLTLSEVIAGLFVMVADTYRTIFNEFEPLIEAMQDIGIIDSPIPNEPRTRALAAKKRQGKGPPLSDSWRGRERNTIFRSQP